MSENKQLSEKDTKLKEVLFLTIDDAITDFLYYKRKEDEELPPQELSRLIQEGIVTVDEIADAFQRNLKARFHDYMP